MEYYCENCGEIFHEDELDVRKFTDWVPYGDTNVPMDSYEHYCPHCGAEDPEEHEGYEECVNCGENHFKNGECYNCGYEPDDEDDEGDE